MTLNPLRRLWCRLVRKTLPDAHVSIYHENGVVERFTLFPGDTLELTVDPPKQCTACGAEVTP